MGTITVLKLDLAGMITRRYEGRLLQFSAHKVVLEAPFIIDQEHYLLLDVVLKRGDRFVETYYDDRYYNLYEIYDRESNLLKGWYCNLSRPARISIEAVTWTDLALDLWVWPDGRRAVLDEDEFKALPLDPAEREQVRHALFELEQAFEKNRPPP